MIAANSPLAAVRLCIDCSRRQPIRDESDRSPCGAHPDRPLAAARRECLGRDWQPFAGPVIIRGAAPVA